MRKYPYELASKILKKSCKPDDIADFVYITQLIYKDLESKNIQIIDMKQRINMLEQENKILLDILENE